LYAKDASKLDDASTINAKRITGDDQRLTDYTIFALFANIIYGNVNVQDTPALLCVDAGAG
jgi:hypothetical protein